MNDYDKEFLSVFNEYYPLERYIFKEQKSLGNLFDDLYLTELFIPETEIIPIFISEKGSNITFTKINPNRVYIKVKVIGNAGTGEIRLGYFDFAEHIREQIRLRFLDDIGQYEYECLYTDYDNIDRLADELKHQKELIIAKYGNCNVKSTIRADLVM